MPRKLTVSLLDRVQRLLEELRRLNTKALRTCQERFQPKIKTSDFTRLDFDLWNWLGVNDYSHKKFSQRSALNGDGLDFSLNGSGVPELINPLPYLDAIAAQELIASLLQCERLVLFDLLKTGGSDSFLVMLKKQLIGFLNALANVLHRLRTDLLPECNSLASLGDMSLKFCTVQMLAIHTVVPLVKRNATVPNYPRHIDDALEIAVPLMLIKLELQGFHISMIAWLYRHCVGNHEESIEYQNRGGQAEKAACRSGRAKKDHDSIS